MMRMLITAHGFDPSQASQSQIAAARRCLQQLEKDPRVRSMYYTTGHSAGCCIICDVQNRQEAQQLAGYLQINGFDQVQVDQTISPQLLQAGLETAERQAPAAFEEAASAAWSEQATQAQEQ